MRYLIYKYCFSELRLKVEVGLCDVEKAEVRFQTHLLLSWTTWLRSRGERICFGHTDFYHLSISITILWGFVSRLYKDNCDESLWQQLSQLCVGWKLLAHIVFFRKKNTMLCCYNLASGNNSTDRAILKWVQKNQYERACYKQNDSKKTDKFLIVDSKTRCAGRQATYFVKNCIEMWNFPIDVFIKWCEMVIVSFKTYSAENMKKWMW